MSDPQYMSWCQFIIFFLGVGGLFIWNRAEGRADNRHMDTKLEASRSIMLAIHEEMKDFHKLLCEIESKRKGD